MNFNFGDTVTILRANSTDLTPYGDLPTQTITRIDIQNAGVVPRFSSEPAVRGRQGVIVGLTLYLPSGTDIRYNDKVEINGGGTVGGNPVTPTTAQIYYVDGQPGVWKSPLSGQIFGIEVALSLGNG